MIGGLIIAVPGGVSPELAVAADAVQAELIPSLGATNINTLIMDSNLSPEDPSAWTADDLRQQLLGSSHDLVFLAGHFSANSALAADYKTHLMASEISTSSTDFSNSLVYSAGCHSGYNLVDADALPHRLEQDQFSEYDAHYFPESGIAISRMSEPKNYSASGQPNGVTVLCGELPCAPNDPVWSQSDEELGRLMCDALDKAGLKLRAPVRQAVTRRLRHRYARLNSLACVFG